MPSPTVKTTLAWTQMEVERAERLYRDPAALGQGEDAHHLWCRALAHKLARPTVDILGIYATLLAQLPKETDDERREIGLLILRIFALQRRITEEEGLL